MITRLLALIVLLTVVAPVSQAQSSRAQQTAYAVLREDGNAIPALTRRLAVRINHQRLGDALRTITRSAGVDFVTAGNIPALDSIVSLDSTSRAVSSMLLHLVKGAAIELLVSSNGPTVVARVPASPRGDAGESLQGIVRDSLSGDPLGGAQVEILDGYGIALTRAVSGEDGRFRIASLPASARDGSARVRRLGYHPTDVSLAGGRTALDVTLSRVVLPLSTVVVTPGYYGVMEQRVDAPQTLTREQIRSAPQVGEDLFRSVGRLPGVSASDFSAAFRVRGGTNRELYSTLDGVELIEPFHLKDFDGAISIIDVGAIAGLDLTTGGFGAQYGNRLTGLMAMRTIDPEPSSPTRTELALTLTTARATSHGTFGSRGGWLLSARRGFLEYALRAAGESDDLRPRYYDVLAKADYRLSGNTSLSLHLLHAGDNLTYQDEQDKPRIVSEYGSNYVWATTKTTFASGLSNDLLLSYSSLAWQRNGTRTSLFDGTNDLTVADDRTYDVLAFRDDARWELSPSLLLSAGAELKVMSADYRYVRDERVLSAVNHQLVTSHDSLRVATSPSGNALGGYASLKARLLPRLIGEVGVRMDKQSYTNEQQVTPRAALAFDLTPNTTLRAAYGRYAQPQALYELQTSDGVTSFGSAELAEQHVLGVTQHLPKGITARVEAYRRRTLRVMPRYVSVDNSIDVFPEIEPDRLLLAPTSSRSQGIEFMINRSPGHLVTWSASYALARTSDFVGHEVPGTLDQRHTFALDAGWKPSPRWQLSLAWLYHTGWPTTSFDFRVDTLTGNRGLVSRVYGPRNVEQLAPYHRLDFRATHSVRVRGTELSAFVDLFNIYNRRNPRAYDPFAVVEGNRVGYGKRVDALLPRLPSFGISWEF